MHIRSFNTAGLAGMVGMIVAVLTYSPAYAQNDKLSGFPAMVLGGQTAKARIVQFSVPFDNLIRLADKDVSLGKTTLDEIQTLAGAAFMGIARLRLERLGCVMRLLVIICPGRSGSYRMA